MMVFLMSLIFLSLGVSTLSAHPGLGATYFAVAAVLIVVWAIRRIRESRDVRKALRSHPSFQGQYQQTRDGIRAAEMRKRGR
jgi:hypothetical protein